MALYSHHRPFGFRPGLACRSQYNVMRRPSVVSTAYQCRRRYVSPRSFPVDFQPEINRPIVYALLRHVKVRGSPGSPRDIAPASNAPASA